MSDWADEKIDEGYVLELLRDAPKGLSRDEFMSYARPDINGGWGDEVAEAWRRYEARIGYKG